MYTQPKAFERQISSPFSLDWEGIGVTWLEPAALPEQFHSSPAVTQRDCGEIALMRAVLEDAVNCFQRRFVSNKRRDQRLAEEAEEWFFTADQHQPFSFVHICTVLGLEPDYI